MLRYQTTNISETDNITSGRFDTIIVDTRNYTNLIIVDASILANLVVVDVAIIVKSDQDNAIIVNAKV